MTIRQTMWILLAMAVPVIVLALVPHVLWRLEGGRSLNAGVAMKVLSEVVGGDKSLLDMAVVINAQRDGGDGQTEWYAYDFPPAQIPTFEQSLTQACPPDAMGSYWRLLRKQGPTRAIIPIGTRAPSWWTPQELKDLEVFHRVHLRALDGAPGSGPTSGYWVALSRSSGRVFLLSWSI